MKWGMSRIQGVMSRMNESSHTWKSHVEHDKLRVLQPSPAFKRHVTCGWVMSKMQGWVMSRTWVVRDAYNRRRALEFTSDSNRHVTCGWVMSHLNESCHYWLSHVTHNTGGGRWSWSLTRNVFGKLLLSSRKSLSPPTPFLSVCLSIARAYSPTHADYFIFMYVSNISNEGAFVRDKTRATQKLWVSNTCISLTLSHTHTRTSLLCSRTRVPSRSISRSLSLFRVCMHRIHVSGIQMYYICNITYIFMCTHTRVCLCTCI